MPVGFFVRGNLFSTLIGCMMDRRMLNIVWMMSMRVGGVWVDLAKSEGLRGGDDGAGGEGRKEGRANWEADEQAVNTLAERLHGI